MYFIGDNYMQLIADDLKYFLEKGYVYVIFHNKFEQKSLNKPYSDCFQNNHGNVFDSDLYRDTVSHGHLYRQITVTIYVLRNLFFILVIVLYLVLMSIIN